VRGIGNALQRRIEEQRKENQRDGQQLDCQSSAEEHSGKVSPGLPGYPNLRRGAPRDKDDACGRAALVRVDAGDEVFRVAHCLLHGSGAFRRGFALVPIAERRAAVFAYAPEMDGDEENGSQRQNDAVQYIEAQQRIGVNLVAAQQQEVDLAPYQRTAEERLEQR